jgi:predicted porin
MYGGVCVRTNALLALVSSALFHVYNLPARAGDLGGACCADLEERIAELEATTARKGNRKVSLTVSGWVNQAVFFWDDGTERNAYVGTNALEQDRFKFAGETEISESWSAGYTIEIGVFGADSKAFSQESTGSRSSLVVRKSNWWIKSKQHGTLQVGLDGSATYHVLDDADATQTRSVSDAEAGAVALGAFLTRSNGVLGPKWTEILRGFNNATPGQDGRRNFVKYYSPTFAGFAVAAAWGEDDLWDAALTYKNDVGDFSVVARAGYGEGTDPVAASCGGPTADFECHWAGAAATVMHNPTGLYVYGGYGWQSIVSLPAPYDRDSNTWFVQPGIERKWSQLGKTSLFAEYRHDEPGANVGKTLGADVRFWAAGIVQGIEAADMILYAVYRHADGDYIDASGTFKDLDAFDMLITGAKINF